jgi:large subunit ribosomal protein L10
MQLADLESREVLLAKLAGAMKGSLAKAARIFDALRIKMEAVSGPIADNAKSEVPAQVETTEAVVETPAVSVETTEAVVETTAETPAE